MSPRTAPSLRALVLVGSAATILLLVAALGAFVSGSPLPADELLVAAVASVLSTASTSRPAR
ncbi:MAG: hypothetical protein M0Z87_10575 [Actinomycetota bacterium]|nr:hypothetical protein [Actinomycetota bacterium]